MQTWCSSISSYLQLLKRTSFSPAVVPWRMNPLSWSWNLNPSPFDGTAWTLTVSQCWAHHRWPTPTQRPMRATSLKPGHMSHTCTELKSAPANCRPAFQRTRNCTQRLEERLLTVHRNPCAHAHTHTHNYPVFTCKYPSAHGFFGKCQLHRCNPGAEISELGTERSTQALSQLWTAIIIIISPNGYVCYSITMVDDSVSLPHLFTLLPSLTPFIRKASHVLLNCLPHPHTRL